MAKSTVESLPKVVVDLTEAPIRVLHVDDEAGFLKTAKQILEMQGAFQVETASSVEEALEKMKKKTYDTIVSDYVMPGKNGLDFLKELRNNGNNIPFVIFTGKGREEVAIKALNLGADHYFNKIGGPEAVYGELAHGIRQAVKTRQTKEALIQSEKKFRNMFESANDAMIYLDRSGRILDVNRKAVEVFGGSKKELLGKHFTKVGIFSLRDMPKLVSSFAKVLAGKNPTLKVCIKNKKGQEIPLECSASFLKSDSGLTDIMVIARDITERKKIMEALKKSEERYKQLFEHSRVLLDNIPDFIVTLDRKGNAQYVNKTVSDLSKTPNVKPEQMVGKPIWNLIKPEFRPMHQTRLQQAFKTGKPIEVEFTSIFNRIVHSRLVPVQYQGKVAEVMAIAQDVTERKQMKDALSYERDLLQTLLESHPDFIYFKDSEGRFLHVSKRFCDFFGCGREDIVGKTNLELFPEEVAKQTHSEDLQVIKTGKPLINKEESAAGTWVLTTKIPWVNKEGTVIGLFGISRDITQRKKAEEALVASEKKYRELVETALDLIYSLDLNGNFLFTNKTWNKRVGFSKEEIEKMNGFELIHPEDLEATIERFSEVLEGKNVENVEFRSKVKDGSYINVLTNGSPILDSQGNVVAVLGVARDITERKKAEKKIETEMVKTKNYIESMIDGVVISDLNGTTIDVNEACIKLLGYKTRKDVIGKPAFVQSIPKKDLPKVYAILENITRKGFVRNREITILTKDKKEIPIMFSATLIKDAEGKPTSIFTIFVDITKRKQMEEALKESEEKYRGIVDLAPDGIITLNMKGVVTSVNSAFSKLTGYPKQEIVGKHFTRLPTLSVKDIPKYVKLFSAFVRGKPLPRVESTYFRRDGSASWVEAHAGFTKRGGKKVGILLILRDIAERKKAEKKLTRTLDKLKVLNEKLGVVGKLTRHDARNKLATVANNVYMAKQRLRNDYEALGHLSEIESACDQVERIFDFARIYEMLGAEELAYIDVEKSLKEAVMLHPNLKGVKVVNKCHELTVVADSLVRQLFYNLIDNSLKHGEKVSRIKVYHEKAGKDKLKLVYEDDGVGISKAEKKKIFKEGYGKGSGYGLYLIRKMCEVYSWAIQETGKQGKGAQFTITIPKMNKSGKIAYRLH